MTGIERLREAAEQVAEHNCLYLGMPVDQWLSEIADQIEREIDEAVADEVADTLSAYEMNTNARWHSAVEEGAESDCKAEFELISRYWLPRPCFEDGEPIGIGSYIGEVNGTDYGLTGEPVKRFEISAVHDSPGGEWVIRLRPGQVVNRPKRDTWERIAADVDSGEGYAGMDTAEVAADVLRRCKALAGVE